jgi:hypothetical protein
MKSLLLTATLLVSIGSISLAEDTSVSDSVKSEQAEK